MKTKLRLWVTESGGKNENSCKSNTERQNYGSILPLKQNIGGLYRIY